MDKIRLGPMFTLEFRKDLSWGHCYFNLTSARELNDGLKKINKWAFQWSFNPDPSKQAQEVIFSHKIEKLLHPSLVFKNNNVLQASS